MGPEGSQPKPDNSQRLTFNDLGVSKSELQAEENNVVNLEDYRNQKQEETYSITADRTDKNNESHNRLKPKAILLTGATLLGSYLMIQEAFSSDVAPIESSVEKKQLDIADIKVGDNIVVSPYDFQITGGNVRTSPTVTDEGENLAKVDIADKKLVKPIRVNDETNSANGSWYVFYDAQGNKFAVNEQNVRAEGNSSDNKSINVTVSETSSTGIIAKDTDGNTTMVAGITNS